MSKSTDAAIEAAMQAPRPFTVAVDLDGTLAECSKWSSSSVIGEPIAMMVSILQAYKKAGARIIIHTCRTTDLQSEPNEDAISAIGRWCAEYKVPYDAIWASRGKPYADIYLEDRGYRPSCLECLLALPQLSKEGVVVAGVPVTLPATGDEFFTSTEAYKYYKAHQPEIDRMMEKRLQGNM